ncbi:hypothetical protein Ddye_007799 [Dipteronia dyeriana]|uniref:Ubiquitin-like protease family profile domain-containing protein n=1 Tax=Dipteronia dyeriana TaxID=168575 RepID=A0AAD9XL56_9ROSI|nr:hypothetical protein Ddye_007799 [Dipteronia dyeriana]
MLWCQCLLFGHFVAVLVWCVGCTRLQMDDISNHEVADEDFPTSTTNNSDQNHIVNEVSTVGRMSWINYFRVESKKLDSTGKTKPRSEIGHVWKALSKEDKASYGHMYVDNVASTSHSKKQTQQNPPETHEECDGNESLIGADDQNMVHTRCTPSRLCRVVDKFSEEQKDVVRALGFENLILLQCGRLCREVCGWLVSNFDTKYRSAHIHGKTIKVDSSYFAHVMGIPDHGDTIHIHGVVPNLDYWGSKFSITSHGIDVKHIEHRLQLITKSDDEFMVTFCLFMLGTLLAPGTTNYVDAGYLIPPFTVTDICNKNWSSWCFNLLCDGIQKYKLGQTRRYLSGCILFLQLFYVHSIHWEPPFVDKSLPPIVCWTNVKIKKCLLRLRSEGGEHGTSSVMDSDMGTGNNATPNTVVNEIRLLRAEIQDLKSKLIGRDEFDDLKRKVNNIFEHFRDDDGNKHASVQKNIHLFDEDVTEHVPCNDNNFKHSPLSFSPLTRPIKPTIFEVSSNDTKPVTKYPKEELPYDERIDDDHDRSNDDYDILNVQVPKFVPSLLNEDVKDEEIEFSSKLTAKKTRTSNQWRHSHFRSSPFMCGPSLSKRGKKFKYGPFQIPRALSEIDAQIFQYIFSSNLPYAEIIPDLPGIQVKRMSFRSLNPRTFVDSEIISALAEYRTLMMKRSRSPLSWYMTTYFVYTVLGSGDGHPTRLEDLIGGFKNTYMYDICRCEQMHALDIVLASEIDVTFSFSSFTITTFAAPEQQNCYDCGLFVCMFMNDNYPSPNQMVTFDSETYRLLLGSFLAVIPENNHLKQLQLDAQNHHKELLSKGLQLNGKKRPGGKQSITKVKGLKR